MQVADSSARPLARRAQTSQAFGSSFKKFGKYLAEQSQQTHAHSALHLCPPPPPQRPQARHTQSQPQPRFLHEADHDSILESFTALNRAALLHAPQQQYRSIPAAYHASSDHSVSSMMGASAPAGPGIFQNMTRQQYSPSHILQSYDTLIPERDSSPDHGVWVIYVHGGYFRDPKVDSTSMKPAIEFLETGRVTSDSTPSNSRANSRNPSRRPSVAENDSTMSGSIVRHKINGYASINYRLSPHPAYPQDPAHTPRYTLNNARYPDHLNDVLAALSHFQSHHPHVGTNYILAGHSVGATLALLALPKLQDQGLHCPKAVVGLSGIYDFEAIHRSNPDYKYITGNAMDASQFGEASPVQRDLSIYEQAWKAPVKAFLIAHSRDDGLVPWDQVELIDALFQPSKEINTETIELHGTHNDIWAKGEELARAIEEAVEMCTKV